jgi:hypothetical protein
MLGVQNNGGGRAAGDSGTGLCQRARSCRGQLGAAGREGPAAPEGAAMCRAHAEAAPAEVGSQGQGAEPRLPAPPCREADLFYVPALTYFYSGQ